MHAECFATRLSRPCARASAAGRQAPAACPCRTAQAHARASVAARRVERFRWLHRDARTPAFQLGQKIHQIALDLDGSADVIVSGALTRAGGAGGALWTGPCAPEAGHIGEGKGISNPLRRAKAIGAGLDWRADVAGRMLTMR